MFFKKIDEYIEKSDTFSAIAVLFVALGWIGVILALTGVFYNWLVYSAAILIFAAIILISFRTIYKIKIAKSTQWIMIIILVAVLIFSYYSSPTVFSGRDQGTLSNSAIQLMQNHNLYFSSPAVGEFFSIYGPGKALNFPGYYYTQSGELVSQFPPGYISWLAIYYTIFGLTGFVIANGVTFFFFLMSLYFLGKKYLKNSSALALIILVITSFIFSWFFKFTLSENLALMLVWLGIYQFVIFLENKRSFYLHVSLLTFGLLLFSRIEAVLFLAILFLIIYLKQRDNPLEFIGKTGKILTAGILAVYVFSILKYSEFYLVLLKNVQKFFTGLGNSNLNNSDSLGLLGETAYVFKIFIIYSLISEIVVGIVAILYFLKKKRYEWLIPFFIVAPTFLYIFDPNISNDHPWILRRFLFSVVPACFLYTVMIVEKYFIRKYLFKVIIILFILNNLIIFFIFIGFTPHKNLLGQLKNISQNFRPSDLVLVDQKVTGDGWSMMTGPLSSLYDIQAVYFINPADLKKIDKSKFSKIYFIIPDDNLDFYAKSGILERLKLIKNYQIENQLLGWEQDNTVWYKIDLPPKQKLAVSGGIYLLNE